MWILIQCEDPAIDPGHNEKRRIIFTDNDISIKQLTVETMVTGIGTDMHPCTPGEGGYHCPICHKDVPPKFPPIPKGALPGKIKIDKKDLDKLSELDTEHH